MMPSSTNIFITHFREVLASIKQIDVEEKFDLYFSRFFGLFFAKWSRSLGLTPTHVSLISLVVGVVGGIHLYWQADLIIVAMGCFLISLAGVLDSADGQLARLTSTSSEFGRMVDGTIDNLVFTSCYVFGGIYFIDTYGFFFILGLGMVAGFAHSVKSAIYEFYKSEYLELMDGKGESCVPYVAKDLELQGPKWYHKLIHYIILDYTSKQLRFVTRSPEQRKRMRLLVTNQNSAESFKEKYRQLNKSILTWYALFCGTNTHRTAIMVLALLGRFDCVLFGQA